MGTDTHHLNHQSNADENGIIVTEGSVFNKNNLANLMILCKSCHNEIHTDDNSNQKKVKTTKGTKVTRA
jgi:5-methylcytosine-specific restriction endonuclease McrA